MALTNFSTPNLDSYFNAGSYYVPDYQRDYAWTDKEEVKDFWEDLVDVMERGLSDYFIGQVVVHNDVEKGKKYLIDGQQRSVTSFILFKVITHFLERIESDPAVDQVIKKKARNKQAKINNNLELLDKEEREDKLWLGETDREYFRDNFAYADEEDVLNLKASKENSISRKNMIRCYRFFHDRIEEMIENLSLEEAFNCLNELDSTLRSTVKILYVETTSEEEAFIIFETLNGRGRDLATSDLLKNFLFRTATQKTRGVVKNNWNSMANTLTGLSITSYIRYLWNSSHAFCREKMLYRAMTDKDSGISNPSKCLDFSSVLERNAAIYRSLDQPNDFSAYSLGEIAEELRLLRKLRVTTFYPVVFAMNERGDFDDEAVLKVLKAIESLVVRDIIVGRRSPNSYEVIFASIAVDISQMTISDADEAVAELKRSCENGDDGSFEKVFWEYKGDDTAFGKEKIRFIFRRIENERHKEAKIMEDNTTVHIEHIMPVKKGSWDVTDKQHADFLWRLGNLTLLHNKLNEEAQNALFDIKKPYYAQSDLGITTELTALDQWRPDYEEDGKIVEGEITTRQKKLAKEAVTIWHF